MSSSFLHEQIKRFFRELVNVSLIERLINEAHAPFCICVADIYVID